MKRKRFIKLCRAAGIPEDCIRHFCEIVKHAGGKLPYKYLYRKPKNESED